MAFIAPQGGTPGRSVGWESRQVLQEITADLDIPTVDPAPTFSIVEGQGRQTYIPGTGRWTADGHTVATLVRGPLARASATAVTLVVVSLLWIPFFLPSWQTPAAAVPIYLRLFSLR